MNDDNKVFIVCAFCGAKFDVGNQSGGIGPLAMHYRAKHLYRFNKRMYVKNEVDKL